MNIVLLKKIRSCEKRLEDFCSKSLAAVHVPYSTTPSPQNWVTSCWKCQNRCRDNPLIKQLQSHKFLLMVKLIFFKSKMLISCWVRGRGRGNPKQGKPN